MAIKPLVIGLTGGIGSGKSAAAEMFKTFGAKVIDADIIAREIVAKDTPLLKDIILRYGKALLSPSGDLDRTKLKAIILENPKEKTWLESQMHPMIYQIMQTQIQQATTPYCVLVIPLLVENILAYEKAIPNKTGRHLPFNPRRLINRILVIDASTALQTKRVNQRDHLDEKTIESILNLQANTQTRLAMADDVIQNNDTLNALKSQVKALDKKYRILSREIKHI